MYEKQPVNMNMNLTKSERVLVVLQSQRQWSEWLLSLTWRMHLRPLAVQTITSVSADRGHGTLSAASYQGTTHT